MLIADSSFLVAFFLPQDTCHEVAKKQFTDIDDRIFISDRILQETLSAINYKGSSEEKRNSYTRIITNKIFIIDFLSNVEFEEILKEFLDQNNKLSFADISVIYFANKSKSKVLAFDRGILNKVKSE